jgi:hypothetical protein
MENINEAVLRLREQVERMQAMACKAGPSLDQAMESLFALSAEQMMLNQMMRGLLNSALQEAMMQKQGNRPGRKAAGAQRSIMERYKDLYDQLKDRPDLPAKPPDVRREMEEVVRDLESGAITEQTLEKQDRILSRMLDGSMSVTKRDYSRRRLAEIEKGNVKRASPGPLPAGKTAASLAPARIDYSSYPVEFHELIRQYLQSLPK